MPWFSAEDLIHARVVSMSEAALAIRCDSGVSKLPRSTIEFSFEEKILVFASNLSCRDDADPVAFLMLVEESGEVISTKFRSQDPTNSHLSNRDDLQVDEHTEERSLFYDPFDWPEYAWIGWNGIDRSAMERIIGAAFTEADFVSHSGKRIVFPSTWSCMC